MKKLRNFFSLATYFICFIGLQAQELKLNPNDSNLSWKGKAAFESYSLTGTLQPFKGILVIKKNTIEKLTVTIDMKSLYHENKDLKSHLRGKDFFEVKTYKTATFVLSKPTDYLDKNIVLVGEMTIKGVTKKEVITAKISKENGSVEIVFDIDLDRTLYGVEYNSPSIFEKLKENAIADIFHLKGTLVFK